MKLRLLALAMIAPRVLASQTPTVPVWANLSEKAQRQIKEVDSAVAPLASQDSARRAGFVPVFGWIPTMGTHWVNHPRMFAGKQFVLTAPSQLMFSPINGKNTLVGVAYAYLAPLSDSTPPESFDGSPAWHEHPDLAPPGMRLVMLHVWLVPSPDGAFAGHNPYLPYWAVGLTPPDTAHMRDSVSSLRVRRAALALAEFADTNGLFPALARRAAVHVILESHRDAVRALIPQLAAAEASKDWQHWNQIADSLGVHWEAIRRAYLESAVNPAINARITKLMDDMVAVHAAGHHH